MNNFERALERELGKLDAPEGFSGRVMQRIAQRERQPAQPARNSLPAQASRWRMPIAAGLLVCAGAGGLRAGYQIHERHQAEQAQQQFAIAMQVTHRSLTAVDRGLAHIDQSTAKRNERSKGDPQ